LENPRTAVLLGAGNRGMVVYGNYALKHPSKLKFVAIAEPIESRRRKFAALHHISPSNCFETGEQLLTNDRMADAAFICTTDRLHVAPTLRALELGYDVLLEKPIAHDLKGCVDILKKVEQTKKRLMVAHVLRYTNFFKTIHEVILSGKLGKVINITQRENVAWYHMAHSFVRGNWRNKEQSSPIILAKCCHDLDLLYWMIGSLPRKISSFGELSHFTKENAPIGAPNYCVEGCPREKDCIYNAQRIYVDIEPIIQIMRKSGKRGYQFLAFLRKKHPKMLEILSFGIKSLKELRYWRHWPVDHLYVNDPEDYSDEAKLRILQKSPYGRCVYYCDNNVPDHQTVDILFENGVTANLIFHGFSEREGRTLRIDGTRGTLIGNFFTSGEKIKLYDHLTGDKKIIYKASLTMEESSHGGGDYALIDEFLRTLQNNDSKQPLTNARESLESHLMAFAAEQSRLNHKIVDMSEYRNKADHY